MEFSAGKTDLFDVVILDYKMPILNGMNVIEKARSLFLSKQTTMPPVLLLSAYSRDTFNLSLFEKNKIDYFLQKPPSKDDLTCIFRNLKLLI
jgi:CheY-like chemotaxis protein